MQTEISPALLASILAVLLSLGGTYIPGLNTKLAVLTKEQKQSIMGGLTILIGLVVYGLACIPALAFPLLACPADGAWGLFGTVIAALVANQGIFSVSPQPQSVREAKLTAPDK